MRKEYDFSKGKRGAVIASKGKTRITIMLDDDVIEHFRAKAEAQGTGYQTMINLALRAALEASEGKRADERPLTVEALREVLREELAPYETKASATDRSRKRTGAGKPASAAWLKRRARSDAAPAVASALDLAVWRVQRSVEGSREPRIGARSRSARPRRMVARSAARSCFVSKRKMVPR